jgi:hypothetical protein
MAMHIWQSKNGCENFSSIRYSRLLFSYQRKWKVDNFVAIFMTLKVFWWFKLFFCNFIIVFTLFLPISAHKFYPPKLRFRYQVKSVALYYLKIFTNSKNMAGGIQDRNVFPRLITCKAEKILKGSLDSIPPPSPSVKKIKLWMGKFAWGVKTKHYWTLSTNFWKQKVCWHHPVMVCLITSSKLSRQ